jgi:hypothetical protein
MAISSRLPSRFPVGTKFIIEARPRGKGQVVTRHLEFPDGRVLRLGEESKRLGSARVRTPRHERQH